MRILVTGATGFIGRHVVRRLIHRGHDVTTVARDATKARGFDWFDETRFVAMNVHQPPGNLRNYFGEPEAVIHLAWPNLTSYQSNVHLDETLPAALRFLEALVDAGAPHLLVAGTCLEYGMQSGALPESRPTAPTVPYALAKDKLRRLLEDLQQRRGFILQWARLFYMYGEGQHPHSLLAQLDRAIDNGDVTFNMSGGEQLRDYLPVEEVASRLVALLEAPQLNGIVNICSGSPISVRNLIEQHLSKRGANMSLNVGYYPYPEYEPMAFWGDGRKFSAYCGNG